MHNSDYQLNDKAKEMIAFNKWILQNFDTMWDEERDKFLWIERNPKENPVKEYDETDIYLQYVVDVFF